MGKPKCSVLVCKVPRSFKPSHSCSLPDAIKSGKWLARRVSLETAVKMAEAFNRTHLPCEGTYRHRWAFAVADLRISYGRPHVQGPHKPKRQLESDSSSNGDVLAVKGGAS